MDQDAPSGGTTCPTWRRKACRCYDRALHRRNGPLQRSLPPKCKGEKSSHNNQSLKPIAGSKRSTNDLLTRPYRYSSRVNVLSGRRCPVKWLLLRYLRTGRACPESNTSLLKGSTQTQYLQTVLKDSTQTLTVGELRTDGAYPR